MAERFFIARDDIETFHEPMLHPFYYGPERCHPHCSPEECAAKDDKSTYRDVWSTITTVPEGKVLTFSKDVRSELLRRRVVLSGQFC